MKKQIFTAVFAILSLSVFAAQPLSEDFESHKVATKVGDGVYSSVSQWRAHNIQMVQIAVVENPNKAGINPSAKVLKIQRLACDTLTDNRWAGRVSFRGARTQSFKIPLTATKCVVELKVLHATGGQVGIRIYPDMDKTTKDDYKIVTATVPASTDWQVVKFDFSSIVSLMTDFPSFIFEVDKKATVASQSPELVVYIDDIKLVDKQ